jgi:hypothetical protein
LESAAAEAKRQLEAVQEGIVSRAATLSAAVGAIDQRIAELDSQFRAAEALIEQEVEALVAQLRERAAVLGGDLWTVYKGKKEALWQQREGLDSLRASLQREDQQMDENGRNEGMYGIIASIQSGLRRAAVLLRQPSPPPSRPSIPGTTALPPAAPLSPPNTLPSSTGLRVELIRISEELAAQHLSAQIPSPARQGPTLEDDHRSHPTVGQHSQPQQPQTLPPRL